MARGLRLPRTHHKAPSSYARSPVSRGRLRTRSGRWASDRLVEREPRLPPSVAASCSGLRMQGTLLRYYRGSID
jgi:hypothetical protein